SGVLGEILVKSGSTVAVGSLLAALRDGPATSPPATSPSAAASPPPPSQPKPDQVATKAQEAGLGAGAPPPSPAALKAMTEAGLESSDVHGSGRRGQILKEDVINAVAAAAAARPAATPLVREAPGTSLPPNAVAVPETQTIAMRDV